MRVIEREEVARRLTYDVCIPIIRQAMVAFSNGETRQLLRSIIPLTQGHLFGIMPGAWVKARPSEQNWSASIRRILPKVGSLIRGW